MSFTLFINESLIFQGLLGRTRDDLLGVLEEDLPRHTINSVPVYGQDKYLVLEDVDVKSAGDILTTSSTLATSSCDVVCLVYDASNPRSFEFVAKIYLVCNEKWYASRDNFKKKGIVFFSDTFLRTAKFRYWS